MSEIYIKNSDDILSAIYGKGDNTINVTEIIKNLIKSNSLSFEISNQLFGYDPCENVVKELILKTVNNKYTFEESTYIKFIENNNNNNNNDEIVKVNETQINYYIVISKKEYEDMIDFYFIYMKYIINKCNHNFIKTDGDNIKTQIKNTKNNVIILYKTIFSNTDMINLKSNSLKIYFLNVEQMSLIIDNLDDNCEYKKNIQDYLIKSIKFITEYDLSIIDYSYENKKIWSNNYHIKNIIVLEPCLTNNMVKELDKDTNIISLFNHIKYRHDFKEKYLKEIEIKSFSGYFCNKRRTLLSQTKILLNIHAGQSYKICELFRIYEAIAHKVIIISQNCYNNDLISLKNYIIFTKDDNFKNTINEVTNNYNTFYTNLFNKSVDDIFKNIELKYKNFFSNIIEHHI